MDAHGTGSIGPHLEDLTIENPYLKIGKLLRMVRTLFKYVILYCEDPDGELQEQYRNCIEELNQSRVWLEVIWSGRYDSSDDGSSDYSEYWRTSCLKYLKAGIDHYLQALMCPQISKSKMRTGNVDIPGPSKPTSL
jgi:hypothetical protein